MTLRVIQVGMGDWGRNWTRNIISCNTNVKLVACVDVVPDSLTRAQSQLDLSAERCFPNLRSALEAYESDAVIITASLPGHVPNALEALNAGKHVLLEKPFAATLAEAQEVVETAARRKRVLMISQNYRFFPAVQAVTKLMQEEVFGSVGTINIDFRRYANTAPPENHNHYKIWQPLLADMSIHHFDLIRKVLGKEPSQVFCQTWNPMWSNFIGPPAAVATMIFDNGTVVNYRGSWVSTGPQTSWTGEWHMECTGGEIVWSSRDDPNPEYVILRPLGKKKRTLQLPEMPLNDRHGSLQAFIEAVQTGQEPESSGRDNIKTLALMLAVIESSSTGVATHLPL